MSGEDQYSFLVPITVSGYLGALLVIAGLLIYDSFRFKVPANRFDLYVVIILALPVVGWFAFRFVQVIRSIHRYNDRGKTSTP